MKRSEVTLHRDNWACEGLPAIDVKVRHWIDDLRDDQWESIRAELDCGDAAAGFDLAWIKAHGGDDFHGFEYAWEWATADGWEYAATDLENVYGTDRWPPVTIEQQGRSGGWLVVRGLPDVEEWDAVLLAKWARFVKYVRQTVDDIPYLAALHCGTRYVEQLERFAEIEERRNAIAADSLARLVHA